MPLSNMTAFPFIAEGSEATPGLWNASWSIISQNIQELNVKAIGLSSGLVLNGSGDPNSNITAGVGFFYEQIDSAATAHPIWVKKIGSGNTGWASENGFMGDAGDGQGAIQIGPNASAQALNTLALGASSFVGPNANQGIAGGFGSTVTGSGGVGLGAGAQVYSPNGVGVGLNAYVGFRDSGAFGSNVSSNASGAFAFGVGATNSGTSSFLFSTQATSNTTANAFISDTTVYVGAPVYRPVERSVLSVAAYGSRVTLDVSAAQVYTITATNGTAFTVTPINLPPASYGQPLMIEFINSAGGAMGTVTFGSNIFTAGAFTAPASTKHRWYAFYWDGGNFLEFSRSAADM